MTDRSVQYRHIPFHADLHCLHGIQLFQIHVQFVINLHKAFRIIRIQSKSYDISDILHDSMGKKAQLRIFDPIWDLFIFQQIHKRDHTLVIPVQNRCLLTAAICHLCQIGILCPSGRQLDHMHILLWFSRGMHFLFMPQCILSDKMIRPLYDPRI